MSAKATRQYRSGTLEKGLDVLERVERSQDPVRIHDIVRQTGFDRAAVFRLLCTLQDRGYIERLPDKRYQAKTRKSRPRICYIAPLAGNSFRVEVTSSMQAAAPGFDLDLHLLDTSDNEIPSDEISELIDSGVQAAILFQRRGSLAHVLADRFLRAKIPVITVDTPVAGAVYFGGNSYRAGLLAGQALGQYALKHWKGKFDRLALLESSLSAPENMARLTGAVEGVASILGAVDASNILHVDGLSSREGSRTACDEMFSSLPKRSRVLVSCFNDVSAMGAVDAVEAAGRAANTAIVGQNGTKESRDELSRKRSALIATVAYFPEQYGERLMKLAAAVVTHQKTPLADYVEHVLLDRANLKQYYAPPPK